MKKQGRFCIEIDSVDDLRHPIALKMVEIWKRCHDQTLIPVREIRQTILPLLISMMDAEQKAKESFKQMETELIDKLDILITENKTYMAGHRLQRGSSVRTYKSNQRAGYTSFQSKKLRTGLGILMELKMTIFLQNAY